MADDRLTLPELAGIFGGPIPMEALSFIWSPPPDTPMSVIRAKLQEMAAAHKAKQGRLEIADAILNAAVNAVCREYYGCAPETIPNVADRVREASEVALRAVIPLIEAAAFERAAKVADEEAKSAERQRELAHFEEEVNIAIGCRETAVAIAAAIRSLTQGDSQLPKDDV